jgi:hypothetical protein
MRSTKSRKQFKHIKRKLSKRGKRKLSKKSLRGGKRKLSKKSLRGGKRKLSKKLMKGGSQVGGTGVLRRTSTKSQFETPLVPTFQFEPALQYHYDVRKYLENLLAKNKPDPDEITLATKWREVKGGGSAAELNFLKTIYLPQTEPNELVKWTQKSPLWGKAHLENLQEEGGGDDQESLYDIANGNWPTARTRNAREQETPYAIANGREEKKGADYVARADMLTANTAPVYDFVPEDAVAMRSVGEFGRSPSSSGHVSTSARTATETYQIANGREENDADYVDRADMLTANNAPVYDVVPQDAVAMRSVGEFGRSPSSSGHVSTSARTATETYQ